MIFNPRRYLLIFGGAMIVLFVLTLAGQALFGINLGSAAIPLIPAMAAAAVEGQRYAREHREDPVGMVAWQAALKMSFIALGLNILQLGLMMLVQPATYTVMMQNPLPSIGILALYFGLWVLVNRFFYRIGLRNERSTGARKR
ncbi:ABZJ_00895 family protein [Nioella nitratireducens]|uniref:ABZJ_00895 family protein n=1 Tax=Nioella nitratireducens TaxID=1287720 RepID=UPI0008FD0DD9|nr:ABZJ_00895 family protein [Nioella nitratireducens]